MVLLLSMLCITMATAGRSLFNPSIVLLYVAAIFVAVHMKATDDQREGKLVAFIVSHAYW